MHPDVTEIVKFYHHTSLGQYAEAELTSRVAELWTDLYELSVVGFGFTPPISRNFLNIASRLICLMPAHQGVAAWPDNDPNVSIMVNESRWPLATGVVDRVIIMHGLEISLNVAAVLDECWRVLAPEGRALIIVPNRVGLWSRNEITPFGAGRPFSARQLEKILGNRRFGVVRTELALFGPPSNKRFWIRMAPALEKLGRKTPFWFAGGVLLMEVHKRIFQTHQPPLKEAVANKIKVLEGIATPGARPVSNRQLT